MLLVAYLVVPIVSLTFSGCTVGGQVGPYSCGDCGRGHCYGEVDVAVANNISDDKLYGYRTKISIAGQMQSGDCFIDNEFWLHPINGPGWIEAGYWCHAFYGKIYFWAKNDNTSGIFTSFPLAAVAQGDVNATVSIVNNGPDRAKSDSFLVAITTDTMVWNSGPIINPLWSGNNPGSQFGLVTMGQELAGSSGATATLAVFNDNSWLDKQGIWRLLLFDGSIISANPPFAGWLQTPSLSAGTQNPNGGSFFTECCLSPNAPSPRLLKNKTHEALAASQIHHQRIRLSGAHGIPAIIVAPANVTHAFKADEVRQYIRTHPIIKGASESTNLNIMRMESNLRASDVAKIIGEKRSDLPEDRVFCYAEIDGPITVAGPPSKTQRNRPPWSLKKAFTSLMQKMGILFLLEPTAARQDNIGLRRPTFLRIVGRTGNANIK